jgi:hypothetical protein
MSETDRRARAEVRRRTATLRKAQLSAVEHDADKIRGEAALSLVAALSREAWSAGRRPYPEYTRAEVPVRVVPYRST